MRAVFVIYVWIAALLIPAVAVAQSAPAPVGAGLVDRISALRLGLERIEDSRRAIGLQRDALRARQEKLAGEIERLKARRPDSSLLPDFPLQQKLRQNQELAESLTLLNRELEALQKVRRDRLQQLALAYDQLVEQTSGQVRTASGQRRHDLLGLLTKARQERELVRRQLLPAPDAPRDLPGLEMLASDDPEELSDRVDEVRDEQDRLRRRLALLDQRIHELQSERRLDRQMRDFISDQEIFDEGSRLLVMPRSAGDAAPNRPDSQAGAGEIGTDAPPDEGYNDPGANPGGFDGAEPSSPQSDSTDATSPAGQLPLGLQTGGDGGQGPAARDDLRTVQKQRLAIVRQIKKLQLLQDRLLEKIEALSHE